MRIISTSLKALVAVALAGAAFAASAAPIRHDGAHRHGIHHHRVVHHHRHLHHAIHRGPVRHG